jgi:Na+-driven multidrug efflux pump
MVGMAGFLHDPATLAVARTPLRLLAATMPLDAIGMLLMNAHLGAGRTTTVLEVTTIFPWGIFLPAALVVGPLAGFGSTAVWLVYVAYRVLQASVFVIGWRSRRWVG